MTTPESKIIQPKPIISLSELFRQKRLDTTHISVKQWLVFIAYFPFGCVIALSRFFLVFFVSLVIPEKYRYRIFRLVLGLHCKTKHQITIQKNGALILSNHSNYLDLFVISAAFKEQEHIGAVIWHGVNFFYRVMCRPAVSVHDKGKNAGFLNELYRANQNRNIVVFPEGAVTDSISGLLQFQRSVFRLQQPLFLIGIRYQRTFPFLQGKAMSRHMGVETLVDFFQPWTRVELISLGEFQRDSTLSPQQQADVAQQLIAEAVSLKGTRWTKDDRHKLLNSIKPHHA